MSINMTYRCDRCNDEIFRAEGLILKAEKAKEIDNYLGEDRRAASHKGAVRMDLCEHCSDSFHQWRVGR